MKFTITGAQQNCNVFMQRIGYNQHRYKGTTSLNFTRRLGGGRFPRFHAYVTDREKDFIVDLHLDMEESARGGGHGGVYDGKEVGREVGRIQAAAQTKETPVISKKETPKKRGLWSKIFG